MKAHQMSDNAPVQNQWENENPKDKKNESKIHPYLRFIKTIINAINSNTQSHDENINNI